MEISFPFVACVRTAGRKKICRIVSDQLLQVGLALSADWMRPVRRNQR
jgi:hypothetical protein